MDTISYSYAEQAHDRISDLEDTVSIVADVGGQLQLVENTGWILKGRTAENYGEVGNNAIDFSYSTMPSAENGATGDNSFAAGKNTIADKAHSFATGKFNKPQPDSVFEIGIGANNTSRSNAFEVYSDGRMIAPGLTQAKILEGGAQSFITKDYIDFLVIDCGIY
jgi:hypothetical protein